MSEIYIDVDASVTVPVNIFALTDDTDFKTRETGVAYNAAGMDLVWNFVTSAGVQTQTAVTPTTGGDYDWTHVGDAMYKIEIPASGGASINNDSEGYGWFSGIATGVLPWRGPVICFRAATVNDALCDGGDVLDVSVTQWTGTNVATPDSAGHPKVTIKAGAGTGEVSLSSGQVTVATNNDKTGYSISGTKTTLDALNDVSAADVNAQCDASIETYHLDHLLAATYDPASKPGASDALLNELIESDAGVSRYTANALEQAPSGGGGGGDATAANQTTIINAIATAQADLDIVTGVDGTTLATLQPNYAPNTTTPPTTTEIRDAVLNRVLAGNHDTAGTLGEISQTVDMLVDAMFHGFGTISAINSTTEFVVTGSNIPATSAAIKGTQVVIVRHDAPTVRQTRRVIDWDDNTGVITMTSEGSIAQVGNYVFFMSQLVFSGLDNTKQILQTDDDGYIGVDASNVANATAALALTNTSIKSVDDGVTLTSAERDAVAAALLDLANGIETGVTLRQSQRAILSSAAGKLSGAATTSVAIRDANDSKDRISATVDADGNRTAVTLDLT